MNNKVTINDVGPRDGLQNQPKHLTVAERQQLIQALATTGIQDIEVGSFVSPKAVPAMANTDQVFAGLANSSISYSALIPNLRGYEMAKAAGLKKLVMVIYGSEGMAQKNVGMSKSRVEEVATEILQQAKGDGIDIIATVTTAFECPFDGPTPQADIIAIADKFLSLGVQHFLVADTIGGANPMQASAMCAELVAKFGANQLGCHYHDTRAMGLANVYASLEAGIRSFDTCIAGLGGCPFAPGATGNVATEDVVMMLHQMGYEKDIDLKALMAASKLAQELTGSAPGGRAKKWLEKKVA